MTPTFAVLDLVFWILRFKIVSMQVGRAIFLSLKPKNVRPRNLKCKSLRDAPILRF